MTRYSVQPRGPIARVTKVSDRMVFDRTRKFIEDFSLFEKPCYHIVESVEKLQKVKIRNLEGLKTEE